jgi:hypothetical protein
MIYVVDEHCPGQLRRSYVSTTRCKPLFAALIVFCTIGQTGFSQQSTQDPYSEQLVSALASRTTPLISMQEKAVNRLGDRAAIGLVRRLGVQTPSRPEEIEGILFVVRMAFATPQTIDSDADREPKATSMLLTYLGCLQASTGLKEEIQQTRTFIDQQVKDYKHRQADTQK